MNDTSSVTPNLEAPPPPARRLSRAGVIAITAAVTLLVALAAIWATRPSTTPAAVTIEKAQDERPADPTFLNTPPRRDPAERPGAVDDPVLRQLLADGNASPRVGAAPGSVPPPALPGRTTEPPTPSAHEGMALDPNQPIGVYRGFNSSPYSTLPPARPAPPREDPPARWRAAFSSPLAAASGAEAQIQPTSPLSGQLPPPPALPVPTPLPAPASPPSAEPSSTAAATRVSHRSGELAAGTVLSAILLTTIHTDNAAPAVAQISLDVRDPSGRILIPRGSRLVGSYRNALSLGDRRIAIAWDRLIVRGHTYQFPGLPGADLSGAAGVKGDVNNHTALVFGRAALLSLIGAGAKLSQPNRSRTALTLTDREVLTSSVADQLNAAAVEYLNRAVNIAPTITVPAGTAFKVLLPYNLTLSPAEATP